MAEYHVRSAAIEDLAFVSQDGYLPREVVLQKIQHGECFVVLLDGELAGYLRLEFLWSLVPYITLIHVTDTFQKRGCSRKLLDFVIQQLQNEGFDVLYSSSQANEPEPQAWHRHMGFEECGMIGGINDGGIGEIFFRKSF